MEVGVGFHCMLFLSYMLSRTHLYKQRVRLVVDSVRVVKLAVVPQDFAQRRILLGHCKHLLRIAAFCQQLPVQGGRRKR